MAKSDVNTGFAKCFILFMAIVILLQGVLYFGLAIWGITQENCSLSTTNVAEDPFRFVLDLIYFVRKDCGDLSVTIPEQPAQILPIDWNQSHMVTNRMFIFLIAYAVISGLWVVGSLLVLATICGPVTRKVSAICFWPWFLVVIAGSILDAVVTGFQISDIVHTTTAAKTFEYIGITQPPQVVMEYLQTYDAYFITPAVVLTCVSSRVILVWLLNIFGTSFCLSLSRVLAVQRHSHHKHHSHQRPEQATVIATMSPHANQSEAQNFSNVPQQNRPAPLIIPAAIVPQQQAQRQATPYSPNAPVITPDVVIVSTAGPQSPKRDNQSNVIADDITYRKTDSHPDRLDYPPKTPQSPMGTTPATPTAVLASASALNSRYSTLEGGGYNPAQIQPQQRASDGLRSHLPWSYTNMLSKPPPPKKPQTTVYPEIPEPDYNSQSAGGQQSGPTGVINNVDQQHAYSRW